MISKQSQVKQKKVIFSICICKNTEGSIQFIHKEQFLKFKKNKREDNYLFLKFYFKLNNYLIYTLFFSCHGTCLNVIKLI